MPEGKISPELGAQIRQVSETERAKRRTHLYYVCDQTMRIHQDVKVGSLSDPNIPVKDDGSEPDNIHWFGSLEDALTKVEALRNEKLKKFSERLQLEQSSESEKERTRNHLHKLAGQQAEIITFEGYGDPGRRFDSDGNRGLPSAKYMAVSSPLTEVRIYDDDTVEFLNRKEVGDKLVSETLNELLEEYAKSRRMVRMFLKEPFFSHYPTKFKERVKDFLDANSYKNLTSDMVSDSDQKNNSISQFVRQLEGCVHTAAELIQQLQEGEEAAKRDLKLDEEGSVLLDLSVSFDSRYGNGGFYIINKDGSLKSILYGTGRYAHVDIERIEDEVVVGFEITLCNYNNFKGSGVIWKPKNVTQEQAEVIKKLEKEHNLGTSLEEAVGLEVKEKVLDKATQEAQENERLAREEGLFEVMQELEYYHSIHGARFIKESVLNLENIFGQDTFIRALKAAVDEPKFGKKFNVFAQAVGRPTHEFTMGGALRSHFFADSPRWFNEHCAAALAWYRKQNEQKKAKK